ncbi:hypothetical protein ABZP36_012984 [Zizania latifolia]
MRSAGQSVVVCVNLFWTVAVVQCFLATMCHLQWGVFILFAALIVVMSIFIVLLLLETKICIVRASGFMASGLGHDFSHVMDVLRFLGRGS